jgi:hypothetical protein
MCALPATANVPVFSKANYPTAAYSAFPFFTDGYMSMDGSYPLAPAAAPPLGGYMETNGFSYPVATLPYGDANIGTVTGYLPIVYPIDEPLAVYGSAFPALGIYPQPVPTHRSTRPSTK